MPKIFFALLFAGLPAVLAGFGVAAESAPDAFERFEAEEARLRAVNTGELRFLRRDESAPLHSESSLRIGASSLDDGWVELAQCQRELDAVEVVEIVYAYRAMRGLEITEQSGIESARIENGSIQLRGVSHGAHVCIRAQVKVLEKTGDGRFRIRSGPYHRRYLDGYFPLSLSLKIEYPPALLRRAGIDPPAQPGLHVEDGQGSVAVHARFTGRLTLEITFVREP